VNALAAAPGKLTSRRHLHGHPRGAAGTLTTEQPLPQRV
jgi:hypothetical protein